MLTNPSTMSRRTSLSRRLLGEGDDFGEWELGAGVVGVLVVDGGESRLEKGAGIVVEVCFGWFDLAFLAGEEGVGGAVDSGGSGGVMFGEAVGAADQSVGDPKGVMCLVGEHEGGDEVVVGAVWLPQEGFDHAEVVADVVRGRRRRRGRRRGRHAAR